MVLLDDDHMCMLCTERFDSQQEWLFHLSAAHMYFGQQAAPTAQHATPTSSYSNATNMMSGPLPQVPTQSIPTSAPHQYANAYSSPMPPPAAPAQLLTPPRSTGTPSPYAVPRSVPQPNQNYGSPYAVTGQAPQHSSPQQYSGQQVFGNMLPRNMSNATPNKLPPQPLQRQFKARNTPAPTYSPIPHSPTPTAAAPRLPSGLPPLPQAVYNMGLSDIDFDPLADHGKLLSTQAKYIDIPSSIGVPDQHMFNANCNTILNFGNLLRLAARYTHPELMANLNSMRKGAAFRFKSAQITKRLKVATEWAAKRPEWQEVGDVQAWLNGNKDARELELRAQHGKRKREDVTDAGVTDDKTEANDVICLGTRSQLPTPPPTKRIKAIVTPTPATGHSARQADIRDLTNELGSENAMALVNALSVESINGAASVEVEMESDAPSSREIEPGENYDEIFAEFLSHPENFMSPMEFRVGQQLQYACDVWMARKGSYK